MPEDAAANTLTRFIGSVPQPDPTTLTTQQMLREVAMLKELLEAKMEGVSNRVTQRLDDNDKALNLLQAQADRIPSDTDLAITALRQLHEARFGTVETQLSERTKLQDARFHNIEVRFEDIKEGVASALTAATALVDQQNRSNQDSRTKSEEAFTKQIDQIALSIAQINKTIDDRLGDVKDRLTAVETASKGIGDIHDMRSRLTTVETRALSARDTQKDIWGYFVGAIGIVISIVTVVFLIINNSNRIDRVQSGRVSSFEVTRLA